MEVAVVARIAIGDVTPDEQEERGEGFRRDRSIVA
jgi:hypothetical protein